MSEPEDDFVSGDDESNRYNEIARMRAMWLPPVMVSMGGFPYNGEHIEHWRERALKAEAAIRALSQAPAPEGWVLVPVEATEAMVVAGHREIDWCRSDQNTHRPGHPSQKPEGVGSDCGEDVRDAYRAMLAACPAQAANTQKVHSAHGGPTHRHKKRGTEYVLIGIGRMQADWTDLTKYVDSALRNVDMREVAIYRSVDDGSLWVRPREEFEDGRFEPLPATPKEG